MTYSFGMIFWRKDTLTFNLGIVWGVGWGLIGRFGAEEKGDPLLETYGFNVEMEKRGQRLHFYSVRYKFNCPTV